jgi:hypothetical protein
VQRNRRQKLKDRRKVAHAARLAKIKKRKGGGAPATDGDDTRESDGGGAGAGTGENLTGLEGTLPPNMGGGGGSVAEEGSSAAVVEPESVDDFLAFFKAEARDCGTSGAPR